MNNKLIIDNFQNDFTKIHTKMNKGIAILSFRFYNKCWGKKNRAYEKNIKK